jgi:predicted nucleotidyltransferase
MIVPEMGTTSNPRVAKGMAAALFSPVQQRVLGLIFGQPERRFGSAELIRQVGSGTGAAHRQLQRLAGVGLVTVSRIGNQKYYQANPGAPIFPEIHGLIVKTVGLVEPLRAALAPVAKEIELAFVFGSVAKGSDRAQSDIDLFVVSDRLGYAEIYRRLQTAEKLLARPINPTVLTKAEWRAARGGKDSFAKRVGSQPRIFVIGDESAAA